MEKEKIESAISDLIGAVERFFAVAPLRFLHFDGGCDDLSDFMFLNRHEPRFHRFESLVWAFDGNPRTLGRRCSTQS